MPRVIDFLRRLRVPRRHIRVSFVAGLLVTLARRRLRPLTVVQARGFFRVFHAHQIEIIRLIARASVGGALRHVVTQLAQRGGTLGSNAPVDCGDAFLRVLDNLLELALCVLLGADKRASGASRRCDPPRTRRLSCIGKATIDRL